jgi:hypothetical protein
MGHTDVQLIETWRYKPKGVGLILGGVTGILH